MSRKKKKTVEKRKKKKDLRVQRLQATARQLRALAREKRRLEDEERRRLADEERRREEEERDRLLEEEERRRLEAEGWRKLKRKYPPPDVGIVAVRDFLRGRRAAKRALYPDKARAIPYREPALIESEVTPVPPHELPGSFQLVEEMGMGPFLPYDQTGPATVLFPSEVMGLLKNLIKDAMVPSPRDVYAKTIEYGTNHPVVQEIELVLFYQKYLGKMERVGRMQVPEVVITPPVAMLRGLKYNALEPLRILWSQAHRSIRQHMESREVSRLNLLEFLNLSQYDVDSPPTLQQIIATLHDDQQAVEALRQYVTEISQSHIAMEATLEKLSSYLRPLAYLVFPRSENMSEWFVDWDDGELLRRINYVLEKIRDREWPFNTNRIFLYD